MQRAKSVGEIWILHQALLNTVYRIYAQDESTKTYAQLCKMCHPFAAVGIVCEEKRWKNKERRVV